MVMLEMQDIFLEMRRIMELVFANVNHQHLLREKRSVGMNNM